MREDLDDHRWLFDGGDDLQVAATLRAVFEIDGETRSSRRAQLMRAGASCAWWAASSPGFAAMPGTIACMQPDIGRQHTVEADQMQARSRHQGGQALREFQR